MVKVQPSKAVNEFDSMDLDTKNFSTSAHDNGVESSRIAMETSKYAEDSGQIIASAYDYILFLFTFAFFWELQASGVAVADDCVTTFNELKLKHSLKFIVYGMNDAMTEIQVLNLVLQLTFKVCLLT